MLVDDVVKVDEYDDDVGDDLETDVVDIGEWLEDVDDNAVVEDVGEVDDIDCEVVRRDISK